MRDTEKQKIKWQQKHNLLISSSYLNNTRFTRAYRSKEDLWGSLSNPLIMPCTNLGFMTVYALKTIYALLRLVGNLLILKKDDAMNAGLDASARFSLMLAHAIMIPINALAYSAALFTRLAACWINPFPAATEDTPELESFDTKFDKATEALSNYVAFGDETELVNHGFFRPYRDLYELAQGVFSPILETTISAAVLIHQTLLATWSALSCVSNLLIGQLSLANDNFKDIGVHGSLMIGLAIITPIHALITSISVITNIGATWHSACIDSENASPANLSL